MRYSPYIPRVLILTAFAALLVAAWAGLIRIGWVLPQFQAAEHGSLMISGFLGTLISLERAVALALATPRGRIAFVVPALAALGTVGLIVGLPRALSLGLITAASAGMLLIFLVMMRRQVALYSVVMTLGAACWLIGNLQWWGGQPVFRIAEWWVAFLVLTIGGERIELSRIMRPPPFSRWLFAGILALYGVGLVLYTAQIAISETLIGISLIGLGLWLLRYDVARRTVKQTGLTRFIASALLAGYVWLLIGGALRIIYGLQLAGPYYDAQLHAILIGFVFSMIFGHAPIILPSVVNVQVVYRPALYGPLILLHFALVLRIVGDLTLNIPLRQWGGMLNVIAILAYFGMVAVGALLARRKKPA